MFQVMQFERDTQGSETNLRTVLSIHFNILKKYGPMAYFNHTSFPSNYIVLLSSLGHDFAFKISLSKFENNKHETLKIPI